MSVNCVSRRRIPLMLVLTIVVVGLCPHLSVAGPTTWRYLGHPYWFTEAGAQSSVWPSWGTRGELYVRGYDGKTARGAAYTSNGDPLVPTWNWADATVRPSGPVYSHTHFFLASPYTASCDSWAWRTPTGEIQVYLRQPDGFGGCYAKAFSLGGFSAHDPAITGRVTGPFDGRFDVVINSDGKILLNTFIYAGNTILDNAWTGWSELPGNGRARGSPATVHCGEGGGLTYRSRLHVVVRGTTDAVYWNTSVLDYQWQAVIGWSGWTYLGGVVRAAPGMTCSDGQFGNAEIFVTGTNWGVWRRTYSYAGAPLTGDWVSGWRHCGGITFSQPTAAWWWGAARFFIVDGSSHIQVGEGDCYP